VTPKLLIFTTVNGRYRVYTDLFTFCCKRAYPDYEVMIGSIINQNTEDDKIKYLAACMRFLIQPVEDQDNYESPDVYITDVDMMICPEKVSIQDFHRAEMGISGLCYSNSPRWKEPHGENRLTGLHYVRHTWWEDTREQRKIEEARIFKGEIGNGKCDDEMMLMRIVKNSGLPVAKYGPLINRHHGIHLGTIRDYAGGTLQTKKTVLRQRIDKEKAWYWCNLIDTADYKKLFAEIEKQDRQATYELKELEKFVRMAWK
jgi:hypothetical protein